MRVGIDLGTTFSAVAWVDDNGDVRLIPSADGSLTTPSVVSFDGKRAVVGHRANLMKSVAPHSIRELFKRDMGKPVERPPGLYASTDTDLPPAPYEFDGYRFGAAGMSALVLRKVKRDAVRYFKKIGKLDASIDERQLDLEAVITVPAHFGDLQRRDTELAGYAAGLRVIRTINEPTAAALAYGLVREGSRRILVLDLGGGTFDVTVLEMAHGDARVLTSLGMVQLGGRDWDEIIERYLVDVYEERTGRPVPVENGYDVKEMAIRAKHELTTQDECVVTMAFDPGEVEVKLHRGRPDADVQFNFEARATPLLAQIRAVCHRVLEAVPIQRAGGHTRPAEWADIDDVVLIGGACRMPMIAALVERMSGRTSARHIEGIDLDTAVAVGAALYSRHEARIADVASHTVGVRVRHSDGDFIEPLIKKDSPLPARAERTFQASAHAFVEVFEGEGRRPDECVRRGRIELNNSESTGTVCIEEQPGLSLLVTVDYPPQGKRTVELKHELYTYDTRATELRSRIQAAHLDV